MEQIVRLTRLPSTQPIRFLYRPLKDLIIPPIQLQILPVQQVLRVRTSIQIRPHRPLQALQALRVHRTLQVVLQVVLQVFHVLPRNPVLHAVDAPNLPLIVKRFPIIPVQIRNIYRCPSSTIFLNLECNKIE